MNRLVQKLKLIATQVCGPGKGFRQLFDANGLEAVLERAEAQSFDAYELVVEALWECCCEDGKYNNCIDGLRASVLFIKETLGPVSATVLNDLGQLLKQKTTKQQIDDWLRSNFPSPDQKLR